MSVEKSNKLETYKGIKKRSNDLSDYFIDLKYNKKRPKYNYHAGLVAGMMVEQLTHLKPLMESKADYGDTITIIVERLVKGAKILVESYNWKLGDLTNLAQQFFGQED